MFEEYFKALGEPTRLRIFRILVEYELCVCELEQIMKISQPRISQHLKILKQAGLVSERREGQRRLCRVNQEYHQAVLQKFRSFMSLPLQDIPEYKEDYQRLANLDKSTCEQ
ncbi:ArsR/SmtB family transcription factor [Syntrophomonas erecta]